MKVILARSAGRGGANIGDDLIRVRHHTAPENMKGIKSSGSINASRGKPSGVDVDVSPFLKPSKVDLGQAGRGAYIEFSVGSGQLSPFPGYLGGTEMLEELLLVAHH